MKRAKTAYLNYLPAFSPALKVAGVSLFAASALSAQTLIFDDFNDDLGANVVGTTPPTLDAAFSGNSWESMLGTSTITADAGPAGAGDGALSLDTNNGGAVIDFGIDPDFTASGLIELSLDFDPGTFTGNTGRRDRGFWVGFNTNGQNNNTGFRGVGIDSTGQVIAGRAWAGDPPDGNLAVELADLPDLTGGTWYNLTATFNLDTGGVESILFDGASIDPSAYTNNGIIAGGRTEQVGFFGNSNSGGTTALVDNFSVTVVPEPSAFGLISALAAFGWVLSRRRK